MKPYKCGKRTAEKSLKCKSSLYKCRTCQADLRNVSATHSPLENYINPDKDYEISVYHIHIVFRSRFLILLALTKEKMLHQFYIYMSCHRLVFDSRHSVTKGGKICMC